MDNYSHRDAMSSMTYKQKINYLASVDCKYTCNYDSDND